MGGGEEIVLETGVATLIAVVGGALAVAAAGGAPEAHQRRISALVSVAAGALLAVTLADVLPEAAAVLSLPGALLAAATGYLLFYLIGRYIYPICPACAVHTHAHGAPHDDSCDHAHHHERPDLRRTATLLGCMVALHAAMDGIAVASGQEVALHASGPSSALLQSLPLLVAVSLHKLPEGLALAALLLGGGFGRARAFALTAGIESATLLGGAVGVTLFANAPEAIPAALMAHTGGGFLYLAAQALRAEGAGSPSHSLGARQIYLGGLGFAAVSLLLWGLHLLPVPH